MPDHPRTTISDDAGRFRFDGLPAGRYAIGAAKEGYVTTNYGARRPGGTAAPVALSERLARTDITVALLRGSVITGTLIINQGWSS